MKALGNASFMQLAGRVFGRKWAGRGWGSGGIGMGRGTTHLGSGRLPVLGKQLVLVRKGSILERSR